MSLNLPANFKNDIQGKDTALVPVVSLDISPGEGLYSQIILSTGSHPIVDYVDETLPVLPLLLNIPSLKESIDIEKRNYKISSVNIDISNFPYEGKRFSELVSDKSLINTECRIFFTSPSAKRLSWFDQAPNNPEYFPDNSAMQVFFGTIRRYTHDDEKVRLVVEDRSQATLHKDLPLPDNYLTGDEVPDKYKNKPIPMVYGHVDRSPLVISNVEEGDDDQAIVKKLLIDTDPSVGVVDDVTLEFGDGGISFIESPLYLYENGYLSLNQYYNQDAILDEDAIEPEQNYNTSNNIIEFLGSSELAQGVLSTWQVSEIGKITPAYNANINGANGSLDFYRGVLQQNGGVGWIDSGSPPGDWNKLIDRTESSFIQIYGTQIIGSNFAISNTPYAAFIFDIKLNTSFDDVNTYLIMKVVKGDDNQVTWRYGAIPSSWNNYTMPNTSTFNYEHYSSEIIAPQINNYDSASTLGFPMLTHSTGGTATTIPTYQIGVPVNYESDTFGGEGSGDIAIVDYRFHEFHVWQDIKVDDLFNRDFYANVNGRAMNGDSPTAPSAIAYILENELGQTGIDVTGLEYDWKYAFTVDKKINSKKLIENIASASPYIPRFDNMGNFRFDVIPEDGGTVTTNPDGTESPNHHIKEADCIDFSFSRTPIEDVYTKIEFKYNWDYARGEFNDSVEADTDIIDDYDPDYYGFKEIDGDIHAESTLTIDGEQGKYIRDHATAQDFANWYLLWSCNQHLKMKIKLPLKYMNLEIGDFVDFDAILGGVAPYGISYTPNASGSYSETVNFQNVFKNFLITSTNKTLEFCEIECIQMHNLDPPAIYGCTSNSACNFNANATNNDGNCWSFDECGDCVPPGNTDCVVDCNGIEGGTAAYDECGVCGGSGIPAGDCNCQGWNIDDCGDCATLGNWNHGCAGCTDPVADNYDPTNTINCIGLGYTEEFSCCQYFVGCRPYLHNLTMQVTHGEGSINYPVQFINEINPSNCNPVFNNSENPFIIELRNSNTVNLYSFSNHWEIIADTEFENQEQFLPIGYVWFESDDPVIDGEAEGTPYLIANGNTIDVAIDSVDTTQQYYETSAIFFKNMINELAFTISGTPQTGDTFTGKVIFEFHYFDNTTENIEPHTVEYSIIINYSECSNLGDINGDGGWNVLDIVALANCVLGNNCAELDLACAADLNGDGGYNILDIVNLANCVLASNCGG